MFPDTDPDVRGRMDTIGTSLPIEVSAAAVSNTLLLPKVPRMAMRASSGWEANVMVSDPATTEASDRCIGAERGSDADSIIACVVLIEVVSLVGGAAEVVVVVVLVVGSNVCVVVLDNSGCWSAGGGVVERVRGGRTGVGNVEVTEEFF